MKPTGNGVPVTVIEKENIKNELAKESIEAMNKLLVQKIENHQAFLNDEAPLIERKTMIVNEIANEVIMEMRESEEMVNQVMNEEKVVLAN